MSNKLDSAHPFRASINYKDSAGPAPSPPTAVVPSTSGGSSLLERANAEAAADHRDEICLERQAGAFKKKAKILGGALLLTALFYGSLAIYDAVTASDDRGRAIASLESTFDKDDYTGTRDVEAARGSLGLFDRLFCKGGRRSTFCN